MAQMQHGTRAYEATGAELLRPLWLVLCAEIFGNARQPEQGMGVLAQAFTIIGRTGERICEAELYRLQGQLTLQTADLKSKTSRCRAVEQAERLFIKALTIARQQSAKSLELRATVSLCRLWQSSKRRQAYNVLPQICDWFSDSLETKELRETRKLLGEFELKPLSHFPSRHHQAFFRHFAALYGIVPADQGRTSHSLKSSDMAWPSVSINDLGDRRSCTLEICSSRGNK